MSDSVGYTPGTGASIAVDDVGGVLVQRIKVTFGPDGSATDVSASDPLPVSLSGTVPVSAASLPLPTGAATEATLATLAEATAFEDAVAPDGFRGVPMLAVRRDDVAPTAADGDFAELQINALGRLKVTADPAAQDRVTGNITTNTGVVFMDVSRTSNISFHCVNTGVTGATFNWEASLNSTNGTDGNWFAVQAVQTNANTIGVSATAIGATPAFGWEASVNGYRWFRIRASAGTFGTSVWTIQPAPFATEPIPAAQISGTQPVSGTVTLGAGTAAVGDVGLQVRANATGAATIHHIVSAASTNVAQIKATAGRVLGYCLSNTNAAYRYVKLHNIASATAGAGVVMTIGIPPNGRAELTIPQGLAFTTAISRSIVAGAADANTVAVGAEDVVGDIYFA